MDEVTLPTVLTSARLRQLSASPGPRASYNNPFTINRLTKGENQMHIFTKHYDKATIIQSLHPVHLPLSVPEATISAWRQPENSETCLAHLRQPRQAATTTSMSPACMHHQQSGEGEGERNGGGDIGKYTHD